MTPLFSEHNFKNLFAFILSQAKSHWIAPSVMLGRINNILLHNNITDIVLPNIYVYNYNYTSYIDDLWQMYSRKYSSISPSYTHLSNCNENMRIDDIKSEVDIRRKTGQLISKIEEADSQISMALSKAETLKTKSREKHSAGWSFGGKDKRLAIEALQSVTIDLADTQEEIIQIQRKIVEGQKVLNQHTTLLYQLGAMSLTANRMVHRELKLKLEHASREELSELAKQELLNTIQQIEQMQDTLIQQEKQKAQLNQQAKKLLELEEDSNRLRYNISESDSRFSAQTERHNKEISALNSVFKRLNNDLIQQKEKHDQTIRVIKNETQQQIETLQLSFNQQVTHLKQVEDLITKCQKDGARLFSEIASLESKYSFEIEHQSKDILELQNRLHILTSEISNLGKSFQTANDTIKEEMESLKKQSYSKNIVWLILLLGVLLSVFLSFIAVRTLA